MLGGVGVKVMHCRADVPRSTSTRAILNFFFFNQKFQARDREISCEKSEMSCESHWESVWWIETSDDPLVHRITAFRHFVFESRVQKSGTGNDKFVKWKGKFRFNRSDRSKWTTFKAAPQYSGRTRPKWSVPFDVPTEITGILGWMESAPVLLKMSADTLWYIPHFLYSCKLCFQFTTLWY